MGIISIEKADRLFWLGRYAERVLTTLVAFFDFYDEMIDGDEKAYSRIRSISHSLQPSPSWSRCRI